MLLRMRDSQGIEHAAGQVLAAAARIGATIDVDRRVMEIAIGAAAAEAGEPRPAPVRDPGPDTLAHQATRSGCSSRWGPRTAARWWWTCARRTRDALSLQEFCREMVAGGVQLCLSQYSYGPEANALLGQLPLGYVRLAARYSSQLHEPAVRDEMRSAIDHAHRLGLQVIGQQVEDAQSAATLWMTGVDFIQGNLVQRPAGELEFDFHNSVL